MTEQATQQQEVNQPAFPPQDNLGEAGGTAFANVYHEIQYEDGSKGILEIGLSGRGRTSAEALLNLLDGLHLANSKGYKSHRIIYQPPAAAQLAQTPPGAVAGSVPPPAVIVPPASGSGAGQPAPASGILRAVKMDIAPRADGKVDIKFFGEGHKFADLTKVAAVDQAILFLAPIGAYTAQHLAVSASYQVSVDVRWAESERRNSKGNPYKDILDIKVA